MSLSIVHKSGNPCPVCHRQNGKCKQTGDGLLICREPGIFEGDERNGFIYGGPCQNDAFHKWFAVDRDDRPQGRRDYTPHEPSTPRPPRRDIPEFPGMYSARDGGALIYDYDKIEEHTKIATPPQLRAFCRELGLPEWSHLVMSWQATQERYGEPCWTTPEYGLVDGEVVVVARHLRFPAAANRPRNKQTYGNPHLPEGTPRRGVFLPTDWHTQDGPLLTVEGASGAWAARVMSCCAIGRPACGVVGTDTIAHLYHQHFFDTGREIWVVADNDANRAGEIGGRKAAIRLANRTNRPVTLKRLMGGIKDSRDWFHRYSPHFDLDTLREKYLESLETVEVIQPGTQDSPVRSLGGDGAALLVGALAGLILPTPPAPVDLSDLEAPATEQEAAEYEAREKAREAEDDPLPLETAGKIWYHRPYNSDVNSCTRSLHIVCTHKRTWNPLEIEKRCGKCPGCIQNRIEAEMVVVRGRLLDAIAQGAKIYERCIPATVREWNRFRKQYNNAPDAPGKGYFRFRVVTPGQPDSYYIITTVASLGAPVDLDGALTEAQVHVATAVRANAGTKKASYSSSDSWKKSSLPAPESRHTFAAIVDAMDDSDRQEMNEGIGCIEHKSTPEGNSTTIRIRLHTMSDGWHYDQLHRWIDSRRMGFLVPEYTPSANDNPQQSDCFADEFAAELAGVHTE